MAPLLYISAFIFVLTASCFAEVVSLRSSSARSQALAERLESPTEYNFHTSRSDRGPNILSELDLLDVVLVASVDGKFHALNRTSGGTLWSMSSFPASTSISTPSTLAPLVRTTHVDHDPEVTDEATPQELYIIEPQSGDIYVMATPTSPLQRFPFSMSELVDMSPFSFSDSEDRRVFVGRKETSLLLIELETGTIKATLNSECAWDQDEDAEDRELDLDELEESKPKSTSTEVYIGRTDYHVSIYTPKLNRDAKLPVQNLSFSVYGPNNKDNHLQGNYRRTKDGAYIQSLPSGEVISFKANPRGSSSVKHDPQPLWAQRFNNPIVAIFDVLRNPSSHSRNNAFVLLQPRSQLQDVLPSLSPDIIANRLESAYVGMVRETGSLFAMSPARFPLVSFSGTEHYKDRLIDAPATTDIPVAVDAITKARKYKEQMEAWTGDGCREGEVYTDRKCLVGIRKLESGDGHETRMRRLLDGPVDGRFPLPHHGYVGAQHTNNETVSVPMGVPTSLPAEIKNTEDWSYLTKKSILGAVAFTFAFGIVSLWFWLKQTKNKRVMVVEREAKAETSPETEVELHDPIIDPTPSSDINEPKPVPQVNGTRVDDDSDREGEADGDLIFTPGKRKTRRGKRGKKKKIGILLPGIEDGDDEKLLAPNTSLKSSEPPPLIINSPKPPPVTPSLIVSETILGFGSHGTVVFQGSLQGRAVAVKRLLQDFVTLAYREVSILQESDDHPNVIRYYYQEAHANFLYIALELCPASLADIIEYPDRDQWRDIAVTFDAKKALRQITSGLKHLHALKLVHRDIKPQNILISRTKPGSSSKNGYRMLISDFGLCKKLDVDQTSFLPTAHGAMAAGTVGWRAPEILRGEVKLDEVADDHSMSSRGSTGTVTGSLSTPSTGKPARLTKSVDIFALGCLFYYTLTSGGHPFGDRFEREVNIIKNAKNLDGLATFGEEGAEAADLITSMLNPEAQERPDTTTCLLHPFFWDPARRLNFLQDASDRFEIMCRDPKDPYLLVLEKDAFAVVGNDWHSRLDKTFIENLGKFRKYDGRSVQDLLRALRNKKHHYQDMPEHVKRHLGPMPEGFLAYFTRRFPRLFLHVHSVIASTGLHTESMFRSYFELSE